MNYLAQRLINYVQDHKSMLLMRAGMIVALGIAYRALTLALIR